jgi:hypothetical protein
MGNTTSVDPRHARIWNNVSSLQSDDARIRMLEAAFSSQEYITAAKRAGVYANLLQWMAAYRRGERTVWPGSSPMRFTTTQQPQGFGATDPRIPQMNAPRKEVKEHTLATVPPPKRALDTLHESYRVLDLDDTKPLTHEFLRSAYKRAATRAHPDRGGSPTAFDEVTRAYLYLEEVLNKLIPKHVERMEQIPVTQEAALKAREAPLFSREAQAVPEGPPVSLNPKNLNMTVFNQLFEQNRLPDPDQDGYGDWLKTNQSSSQQSNDSLRAKFNADVFNKTFVDGAKNTNGQGQGQALAKYQHPDAITHSAGVELGRDRPAQYTSALGSRTAYTDLKYAYGDGSTFSQEVAGAATSSNKTFDQMKRERESAPVALSAEEFAAVQALDAQKKRAEEERLRRLAAQDVDAESVHARLKQRLMIQ